MKPLSALVFGLIMLVSCGSPKASLPEFGEDIYEAIKSQDYDRYARHSLLENKEFALELDVLFGEPVKKDRFEELHRSSGIISTKYRKSYLTEISYGEEQIFLSSISLNKHLNTTIKCITAN